MIDKQVDRFGMKKYIAGIAIGSVIGCMVGFVVKCVGST